jgi:hypothetical protein
MACGNNSKQSLSIEKKGIWRVDSIVGENTFDKMDRIYFIGSNFWRIKSDTCPMILDSCLVLRNDSIFDHNNLSYTITDLDSEKIKLNSLGGKSYILKKLFWIETDSETQAELNKKISEASLGRRVAGWWKFFKSTSPDIHLVNYPNEVSDFTLELGNNGKAAFYLHSNMDSAVYYGWETNIDGLSFSRYCIAGSDTKIYSLSDTEMELEMGQFFPDTVYLRRCEPLRK